MNILEAIMVAVMAILTVLCAIETIITLTIGDETNDQA